MCGHREAEHCGESREQQRPSATAAALGPDGVLVQVMDVSSYGIN